MITRLILLCAALSAGCAGGGAPPVGPSADPVEPEAAPVAVRDTVTLQQRWASPFAVESSGRPDAREVRLALVIPERAPEAPARPRVARVPDLEEEAAPAAAEMPAAPLAAPAAPSERAAAGATAARPAPRAQGDAPTPTGTATVSAGAKGRIHRVAAGETFFGIARRYGVSSDALAAANPAVEPGRLRTGHELRIPAHAAPAQAGERSHTVVQGETLWGIARRYGVSVDAVRELNRLGGSDVRTGQTLRIPRAT